jgi:AcrR family transcriptional regulator
MKDKILALVAGMYLKYGVRSVSMDDIAHELAISKKTIYQHFEDKDDLVKQVTLLVLKDRQNEFDKIGEEAANAIEELSKVSICIRKEFTELNPSLMYDIQKYHPQAWELFLKHEKEVIEKSIVRNLEQGVAQGYFRTEIDVRVLARLRVQQIHMSFDDGLFPKKEFDFTEVQMQMFDHFVYGLLTNEGLALYKQYQSEN